MRYERPSTKYNQLKKTSPVACNVRKADRGECHGHAGSKEHSSCCFQKDFTISKENKNQHAPQNRKENANMPTRNQFALAKLGGTKPSPMGINKAMASPVKARRVSRAVNS